MWSGKMLLLVGLLGCSMAGCKKEVDDQAPRVSILLPLDGAVFAIPDTIHLRISVRDERQVKQVSLLVVDDSDSPVVPPIVVATDTKETILDLTLPLTDEGIVSGNYTLIARANDGSNDGRAFRSIQIQAAPLRLRALFVTPPFGQGAITVTRIDSTGAQSTWVQVNELGGAAIDASSQHLYLAGSFTQPLTAMPTLSSSTTWTANNLNPANTPLPYFLGLHTDPVDGRIYVGTQDGLIRGWTGNGASTFTASTVAGYRSQLTAVVGDRLASVQVHPVLGDRILALHAYASGAPIVHFPLDLDVHALFARGGQHALLFGTKNGNGVIQDRSVGTGGSFEMHTFTGEPVMCVAEVSPGTYLVGLPERIIRFSYTGNTVSTLAVGVTATDLVYDPASGAVYAALNDNVSSIDPQTGSMTAIATLPHVVGRILPLRNR